jgi:hypothetical protein
MKTNLLITGITLLALSTFNPQLSTAFAQGSLTPPGPPAPTMKTADQIEPRTPISSAPFNITNSGSYYLTTNLTVSSGDAIDINANGVTLDLNGFTISSSAFQSGNGIYLVGSASSITILNGHISGGFFYGIVASSSQNVLISKVSVATPQATGIQLPVGTTTTVVENCTVTSGYYGIIASIIKGSVANSVGYDAIDGDQVIDCRGISSLIKNGIVASAIAQNCYGQSGSGTGLQASIAICCVGYSTSGIGLSATNATSCWVQHGTTNICYKYNMP